MSWEDILKKRQTLIDNKVGWEVNHWINSIKTGKTAHGHTKGYPSKSDIASNKAEFKSYVDSMNSMYKELEQLMKTPFSEELMAQRRAKLQEEKEVAQEKARVETLEERKLKLRPLIERERKKRLKAKEMGVERTPQHTDLLPEGEE